MLTSITRKTTIATVILCFAITAVRAQKKEVRAAFESYKSAILNDRGEEALKYLDSRTTRYYNGLAQKIRSADSIAIESFSLVDKFTVLMVRFRAGKEDILSFDGKSLLLYAIRNGMVGKNSVINNTVGEVIVNNDFAKGELVSKGKKTSLYFHFYREEGIWKIDITKLLPFAEVALQKAIEESGQSEKEFILSLLELTGNKKPGIEIWQPVKKS